VCIVVARIDHIGESLFHMQLINHGVSNSLVEKVKRGVHELFNLPIEEKKMFAQREGEGVEGYGQAFVVSEEQKLEWADMFFMLTLPPQVRKPYLFPKLPLPFRFHSLLLCSLLCFLLFFLFIIIVFLRLYLWNYHVKSVT